VNAAFNFSTQGGAVLLLEWPANKRHSGFWWLHEVAEKEIPGYGPDPTAVGLLLEVSKPLKKTP
jgi:hypothetical protein